MKKNKEPLKVVIDGNEYNFSFEWDNKPYIKEPTRSNCEFDCFVEPCKYIKEEDLKKLLVELGHNVEYGKETLGGRACPYCGRVYGDKDNGRKESE